MCFCKASQNNNEVKLYFRQEDLLSKLLDIGLVSLLERQIMMNRKKLLFLFHIIDVEVSIDDLCYSHPILVKGWRTM